jgi:D-arabinono-1,4-lactone oxidase
MDPILEAELRKLNDGVPFRASTNHAHHTWARTFHSSPELYVQPQSVEEIQKAITLARRCRRRITTVGCGHSPSDLTCTSSWMVNLDNFNKVLSVDEENGIVLVQAGIRLWQLGEELDKHGLALPNLGSINQQSLAGAIATGTHGSTLYHSILSSSVLSLRITLSNSRTVFCSPSHNLPLFRAALLSLGALGIITEITFQAVPAFMLHWKQTTYKDTHIWNTWPTTLWTQEEFVRVWWFPYTRRATVWRGSKTSLDPKTYPLKPSYYDEALGYHVYHNLLYLAQYIPRILPWVEWFVFGMQYGFSSGPNTSVEAIQPSRQALLMNCLYSQYVNEWAISLHLGPIALRRLSSWLNHLKPSDPDYVPHGIPYSAEGLWVHAPVEVRVSDTTSKRDRSFDGTAKKIDPRPYLDPTVPEEPTLFLNATLYRPYNLDPPCRTRYYQAFEYLMRELGGKPHWAKNFETTGEEIESMYGDNLQQWREVRNEADPEGMFVGSWHRRYILGVGKRLPLEEEEVRREMVLGGGLRVVGAAISDTGEGPKKQIGEVLVGDGAGETEEKLSSPSSQSSFDVLHGGEAVESQVLMP